MLDALPRGRDHVARANRHGEADGAGVRVAALAQGDTVEVDRRRASKGRDAVVDGASAFATRAVRDAPAGRDPVLRQVVAELRRAGEDGAAGVAAGLRDGFAAPAPRTPHDVREEDRDREHPSSHGFTPVDPEVRGVAIMTYRRRYLGFRFGAPTQNNLTRPRDAVTADAGASTATPGNR